MLNRRSMIYNSSLLIGGLGLNVLPDFFSKNTFKIGACDWSIGKSADVTALTLAKEIGLDGIQVNMGSVKNDLHLRQRHIQEAYLALSKATGVKISSLAIGELNEIPYKSDERTEKWVSDAIDVAKNLGVNVILLAFFSKNDLRSDAVGKTEVIRRLRSVVPKAEKMGITLGIESYLTAEEHLDIMQQVGSKAVKVYYDFRNATDAGNDIFKEIKLLGKDNICELHIKENGVLLGKGSLDWQRIAKSLDEIGYVGDGWVQIEGAMPNNVSVVESYKQNLSFVRNILK
jgi:L-ribulose-5-phosphate 3-epimerase